MPAVPCGNRGIALVLMPEFQQGLIILQAPASALARKAELLVEDEKVAR